MHPDLDTLKNELPPYLESRGLVIFLPYKVCLAPDIISGFSCFKSRSVFPVNGGFVPQSRFRLL